MAKRSNESARILNFFTEASLDKAEVIYDLVRDVMSKRLAPKKKEPKAAAKSKRVKKSSEAGQAEAAAD